MTCHYDVDNIFSLPESSGSAGDEVTVVHIDSPPVPPVCGHLDSLLRDSLLRHRLPGASIAVLENGRIHEAAAGWANEAARIEATPDTLFHFGSVTKTLTSTLVALLIDRGMVDPDAPVARYVSEFAPADPAIAEAVTVRHCLNHTSGLVGTIFVDTGRNEDTLARQVGLLNAQPLYHPTGALLSYCNSGMALLGRLIETLLQKPWHAALQEDLGAPLGMQGVVAQPEQALRGRYAVGHLHDPASGGWVPDPHPFLFPGHMSAGSTPCGRARDLALFAGMHIDEGVASNGQRYLSASMVKTMRTRTVASPVSFLNAGFGLGWSLYDWGGTRMVGHDGATASTLAFLRTLPERRVAVALLVNCRHGMLVYEDLFSTIFTELCGVWEPGVPPTASAGDLASMAGSYSDGHVRFDLSPSGEGMRMSLQPLSANPLSKSLVQTAELHPCGTGQFFVDGPDALIGVPGAQATRLVRPFAVFEAAGMQWLHAGTAAYRRL